MTPVELTMQIKSLARECGFDEVGVTTLEALRPGEEALSAWTKSGRYGTMKYLEEFTARRERFLSEFGTPVRSILVLGVNYYSAGGMEQGSCEMVEGTDGTSSGKLSLGVPGTIQGKVARYAWGRDYHEVIRERHQALITKIQSRLGISFKVKSCVDTQPIPERYAAVQAGFGFLGKHTILLSKKFGPWMFLSEIVTDLELAPDSAAKGDCGTCTECQGVCPTGALNEDYEIDARLCIAYLTIEYKGIIPRELRPKIKDWIFGCDECLMVCPFTSKQRETSWPEFRVGNGAGERLEIGRLFDLKSNADYERQFARSAILRAGRKQLLRNACIVLGNSGDDRAIPYLEQALSDPAPLVRLHAVWALGQFGERTTAFLEHCLVKEEDSDVRAEIEAALSV